MKPITKSLIAIFTATILCVGLSGCGSKKKAVVTPELPAKETTKPERSLSDDFRRIAESYSSWDNVSMPVKVRLTAPKRMSLSGTLNMTYGEALELNLRMLFIDAMTVYADRETVIILSKPLDVYFQADMNELTGKTGLDLSDLQSLLLGQLFRPGSGTATADALDYFSLNTDTGTTGDITVMDIRPQHSIRGVDWYFRTTVASGDYDATPLLSLLDITSGPAHFQCLFDEYFTTAAGMVAGKLDISGKVKSHEIGASIISDPERAKWNRGTSARKPNIPSGMRRMTTEQIFKILKQQ